MFDALSRSHKLTKMSWRVLMADKEMLLFPFLGGVFSILFLVAVLFPTVFVQFLVENSETSGEIVFGTLQYIGLFITYFGLAFIATFFNVCTVYTTKARFDGGDASFMDSIKFAFSRIHLIAAWSTVSATFGLLMRAIDHAAERAGIVGEILLRIVQALLSAAWSITTLFVVPAMVYEGVGPFAAIKSSVNAIQETWGESLIRHFGLGWMQSIFIFLGLIVGIPLIVVTAQIPPAVATVVGGLIVYLTIVVLVFNVMNSIFNTALYVYANTGKCPGDWDDDLMSHVFAPKG